MWANQIYLVPISVNVVGPTPEICGKAYFTANRNFSTRSYAIKWNALVSNHGSCSCPGVNNTRATAAAMIALKTKQHLTILHQLSMLVYTIKIRNVRTPFIQLLTVSQQLVTVLHWFILKWDEVWISPSSWDGNNTIKLQTIPIFYFQLDSDDLVWHLPWGKDSIPKTHNQKWLHGMIF